MFSFARRTIINAHRRGAMRLRKWYFAINEHGLLHANDQIRAAIASAKENTSLVPYCLVDDAPMSEVACRHLSEIEAQGATIIRHRSFFYEMLYAQFGERMLLFSGHWLRCDIPILEKEDDFVLYTDIDVVFLKDPTRIDMRPSIIACAPEHHQDNFSYFNSGVMIMNVPALRATSQKLKQTVIQRLRNMAPHDDQGALNECYKNQWDRLPNIWNWKPYWGHNEDAGLLHFHGPKPGNVREMLAGETSKFGQDYEIIFGRNPEGYRQSLYVFDTFCP
jgi:hypothetical protein